MITVLASILEDQCSEEVTAVDQHRSWISSKGAKGNFEGGINEYLIQTDNDIRHSHENSNMFNVDVENLKEKIL